MINTSRIPLPGAHLAPPVSSNNSPTGLSNSPTSALNPRTEASQALAEAAEKYFFESDFSAAQEPYSSYPRDSASDSDSGIDGGSERESDIESDTDSFVSAGSSGFVTADSTSVGPSSPSNIGRREIDFGSPLSMLALQRLDLESQLTDTASHTVASGIMSGGYESDISNMLGDRARRQTSDRQPLLANTSRLATNSGRLMDMLQHIQRSGNYTEKAAQLLSLLSDTAASTLSFSAAAISNKNVYQRSLGSGALWAMSGALNCLTHTVFTKEAKPLDSLADASSFSAGVASVAAAILGNQENTSQRNINAASYTSNLLWLASGSMVVGSVLKGDFKLLKSPETPMLEYAANGLQALGGIANAAAAAAGVGSIASSDGSDVNLNKSSAGLWMAGSALSAASAILSVKAKAQKQAQGDGLLNGANRA